MSTILTHAIHSPLMPSTQLHTVTFSDQDFQTVMQFLAYHYTPQGGVAPPPEQCILLWLQEAVNSMLGIVHQWQIQQQQLAAASIPPIVATFV